MLLDRPLKLCHGPGNGVDTACLMTASNMLIGEGYKTHYNSCVCKLLSGFIIPTNDAMPIEWLGELYGPLAWEIIGTWTVDSDVVKERAGVFRRLAWRILDEYAIPEPADPVMRVYAAEERKAAFASIREAATSLSPVAAVHYSAVTIIHSYRAARTRGWWKVPQNREIWVACRDAIREAAAIGDRRPVEEVMTHDQLCLALGGV